MCATGPTRLCLLKLMAGVIGSVQVRVEHSALELGDVGAVAGAELHSCGVVVNRRRACVRVYRAKGRAALRERGGDGCRCQEESQHHLPEVQQNIFYSKLSLLSKYTICNCCAFAFSQSICFGRELPKLALWPALRASEVPAFPSPAMTWYPRGRPTTTNAQAQRAWCVHCARACLPALRVLALPVRELVPADYSRTSAAVHLQS